MAKAKLPVGGNLNPLSVLGGAPSFTGGTAGPSQADGSQSASITFGSPFAVGAGASANAENKGSAQTAGGQNLIPWLIVAVGLVALAKVVK